ncbi:hypothetical protein DFP93_101208 [Aneurinibacillus soli]|uniref:Uncharacterized protein n=1 Tax=Aneurinibacillus soli TaxID=1500254 RepID=A0A0U4NHB6_9BACL|nr:hypothetical protein [Aneurinibacillus soli]PYE64183.1 hypothetical protein DFP93_101208 [Aneurinibacillus soli]BAU28132.1 hypothetical protein CB4_02306 [Aneurinibacillus soli]
MKRTFTLCTENSCCPVVEVEQEMYTVKDDFGGVLTAGRGWLLDCVVVALVMNHDDVVTIGTDGTGKVKLLRGELEMLEKDLRGN